MEEAIPEEYAKTLFEKYRDKLVSDAIFDYIQNDDQDF